MNHKLILSYLVGLLNHYKLSTGTALAEILGNISHDSLTGLLHKDWNAQCLLYMAIGLIFGLKDGYLLIDDILLPKSSNSNSDFIKKLYSGKYKAQIKGISIFRQAQ